MEDAIKQQVEKLLNATVETYTNLGGSPFSHVWRVQLSGQDNLPASVIVKQMVYFELMQNDGSLERFIREYAALDFIQRVFNSEKAPVPKVYVHDMQNKLLIMEDFFDALTFDDILLGNDIQKAEVSLIALGRSLGQIHARTYQQEETYQQLYQPHLYKPYHTLLFDKGWSLICQLVDMDTTSHLETALAEVKTSLHNPPCAKVLVHKDICTGNLLWTGDTTIIIDYENSCFDNPAFDMSFIRCRLPTCSSSGEITSSIIEGFETAYRQEFAKVFPAIQDNVIFYPLLLDGIAYMMGYSANWIAKMAADDWRNHDLPVATGRQRLLYRLQLFGELTQQYKHHEQLGAIALEVARKLEQMWHISPNDMPFFPVFRA